MIEGFSMGKIISTILISTNRTKKIRHQDNAMFVADI